LIHIAHSTSLSAAANFYVGQALTVTSGPGAGNTYKITRYEHGDQTCVFAVDHAPDDALDDTSKLAVTPVLNVTYRGLNGTLNVSHSSSLCGIYRVGPYLQCDNVQYYSGEMDMSLYDFSNTIARKAGVLSTSANALLSGSYTTTPLINRRNFIVNFPFASDMVLVEGRKFGSVSIAVKIYYDIIRYVVNGVDRYEVWLGKPLPSGIEITVSYFDEFISIWGSGKLLASFAIYIDDETGADGIQISATTARTYLIREACARVDNFILDAGRKSAQLFSDLIGEKRFFIQDDENGDLRIYAKRNDVNTVGTPYVMTVTDTHSENDATMVTRLRLEGTDVSEQYDPEKMIEHGNLYHQSNMMEINSQADAAAYTAIMLDDIGSRTVSKTYFGAIAPKLEAGDTFYVQTPEGVARVLVDNLEIKLQLGEFDMSVSGRIPRSSL
jgi:hypothetical protein